GDLPGKRRLQRAARTLHLYVLDGIHLRVLRGAPTVGPLDAVPAQGFRWISMVRQRQPDPQERRVRNDDPVEVHQRRRTRNVAAMQLVRWRRIRIAQLSFLAPETRR